MIARAASLMRPKDKLRLSEWAERNTDLDLDALPWAIEVMDALSDPAVSEVGLEGPAQAMKSEIGLCWIGYLIEHAPADLLICQPDKSMMQDFVIRRIGPMIERTPAVKAQLLPAANADNIFLKQFRGMLLTSIWPVGAQFRARPVPNGWLDDYDDIPDDIDGQGSAIKLLDARQTTFEGRDTKYVSSSPAREDGSGIEAFVEAGTDERLQPVCPSCGERFEPDLTRDLRFEQGTLEQAEKTAHVVCPVNGCILEPQARRDLLESLQKQPSHGFVAKNKKAGTKRRTFRVDGLLAFSSWSKLAREWREAQLGWELRQDESGLRSFVNTKAGRNYRSQFSGEEPLKSEDLAKRRERGWKLGTVPPGPEVLVTVGDVQANRFECATIGFGEGLETWLVDRWSIDALDDGLTIVSPFKRPEDWQVLLGLWSRALPIVNADNEPTGETMIPLSVAIDTGGLDQATEGAKRLWHAAVAMGVHKQRITLLKGSNSRTGKLMPTAQFADQKLKGGGSKRGPKLWMPNVHALKNIIDARLRRETPGPGYIHLPGNLPMEYCDEITAEELQKGKWEKIRARNETWDLLVYAYASILKPPFAQSVSHMRWVPGDFRIIQQDGGAKQKAKGKPETKKDTDSDMPETNNTDRPVRARRPRSRGRQSWMGRLK